MTATTLEYRGRLLPEAGNQPALVFVHGAGGAATMWLAQLRYFKPKRSTLAPFLPGHGEEGGPGRERIADYVEDLRGFLDAMQLDRVVLVGLSMGGAISQLFALTHPDRLAGLVLASTGAKLKVLPVIFETLAKDFEGYLLMMGQFSFGKSAPEEIKQEVLEETRKQRPEVIAGDFRACDAFDVRERLSEIRTPTLVLSGAEDLLTPPKYGDLLVERIPGARLVRFPGAGHLLPVEKPEAFNQAVEEFLEGLK
jgi:pimeloyl-ACP methyl ester carboxylesterase